MSFLTVQKQDPQVIVPVGKYTVALEATATTSSKGDEMLKVVSKIADGQPFANALIWDYATNVPQNAWKFQQLAHAVGFDEGTEFATMADFAKAIDSKTVLVTVKHEKSQYNGEDVVRAKVAYYDAISAESPKVSTAKPRNVVTVEKPATAPKEELPFNTF
jgi:hypothetical protein